MQKLILRELSTKETPVDLEAQPGRFSAFLGSTQARHASEQNHQFCYWRLVGRDNADLFSVEIDRSTGEIFTIELLAYHHPIRCLPRACHWSNLRDGTPTLDLSEWVPTGMTVAQSGLSDIFEDFVLEVGSDTVRVNVSSGQQVDQSIRVGQCLVLEFNAVKELVGVAIIRLSEEQVRLISWKPEFDTFRVPNA